MANQLRAHLQIALPRRDRPVPRHRLRDHAAVPDAVPQPGQGRLALPRGWAPGCARWATATGQPRPALHAHLHDAPRGTTGPKPPPGPRSPLALVAVAERAARPRSQTLDDQIADQLDHHPDAAIFTSLPKAGTVRAARLLAEIGDARGRFPTAEALACLAGAAPSTRSPGKVKIVTFRWAVDKQLRDAVMRLRRRLPPRQPLGRRPLPTSPRPRPRPPPRRPHPRPRLAPHHLALLARPTPPTTPPSTAPSNASNRQAA